MARQELKASSNIRCWLMGHCISTYILRDVVKQYDHGV